jgi:hypothetical protein
MTGGGDGAFEAGRRRLFVGHPDRSRRAAKKGLTTSLNLFTLLNKETPTQPAKVSVS